MTESAFNRPVPVQEQQAALKAERKPTAEPSNEGEKPEVPSGLGIVYQCAICEGSGRIAVEFPPSKRTPEYAVWHAAVCADVARDHAIHAPDCAAPIAQQLDIAKAIHEAADPPPTSEARFIDPPQPLPGSDARELTEAEASAAIEAAMHERIAEAIDNDLETRARVAAIPVSGFAAQITEERVRYEGTFQGEPIVSNPAIPPGVVARVRLTAEQLEATKHLKPGDAFAKAVAGIGESLGGVLEPEPAKKPEDLDGF